MSEQPSVPVSQVNSDESEQVVDRFESAWQTGPPPAITDFLPSSYSARLQLLPELVMIDLEYRWRRPRQKSPGLFPVRPRLEAYLDRFPELGPLLRIEMIGEEYRVRRRWGDRPDQGEYMRRFPRQAADLEPELARIDAELASDSFTWNMHGRSGQHGSPLAKPGLYCPHCGQAIDIPTDDLSSIICSACGGTFHVQANSTAADGAAAPPVARLGRYELVELLGTGAFGSVWRARDTELARDVALKLPRSGQFLEPADEERFLREARSAAGLQHAGIVTIHDIGRDQELLYIVSELVSGLTLAERLRQRRLGFREAAELIALVADALEFAHQRGVIHRDVKPSNIMLSNESQATAAADTGVLPRLLDFGLALGNAGDITMTLDGQVLGTPAYMSPEQIRHPHAVDGRSDVYSLGVILYELLTGELPFRGMTRMVLDQVLTEEPRPPRRLNDRIPRDLETICLKCLEKERGRRYRSAAALAGDLRRWLSGQAIRARPVGRPQRLWLWARRNPVPAISITLALVALVASAGIPVSMVVLAMTVLCIAALLFAVHKARVGNELAQAMAFAGADQQKAAATLHISLKQSLQARQERDRAAAAAARAKRRFTLLRKLAKAFLFDMPAKIEESNPTPARLFLIQTALVYLDGLAREVNDDPLLLREVAVGYARVGDLQENTRDALTSHRHGLELFAELAKNLPLNAQAQRDWAVSQEKVRALERLVGPAIEVSSR